MDSAPVILARALGDFTQWALGRALAAGVRRLYFLSRDGWYPFRLGEALCRGWDLPIECRYLYGSRRAWRLPLAHRDPARLVGQLCGKGGGATLGEILFQAGLSPREAGAAAAPLGVPQELPLSPGQRRELAPRLLACPAFLHPMETASRQALGLFLGYLRQEGLGEDVPWALVDSGWMGSTQDTLGEALTLLGRPGSPRGYYAGLYRAPRRGRWEGFFFQPGERLAIQAGFEPSLWEAAFAAPHGTVLGYGPRDGGFVPLLRQQIAPAPGHRAHPRQLARGGHLVGQRGHNPLLHGLHGQGDLPLRQGRRAGLAGLHADGQGFQRWIVHSAARHKADAVFLKARQRRVQRTADHIAGSRRAARLPGHIRVAEPVQFFLQSGLVGHKRRDVQSHFMVVLGGNKFGLHTFPPIFSPAMGCARR